MYFCTVVGAMGVSYYRRVGIDCYEPEQIAERRTVRYILVSVAATSNWKGSNQYLSCDLNSSSPITINLVWMSMNRLEP